MPRTPDRFPGVRQEEGLLFSDEGVTASQEGEIRYTGGRFSMFDGTIGEYDPSAGTGLSEAQHEELDTLTHDLVEDSFTEVVRSSGQIQDVKDWQGDASGTTLIREVSVTRSGGQIATIVRKQYNGAGTLLKTHTGTVVRVSGRVSTIDWEVA